MDSYPVLAFMYCTLLSNLCAWHGYEYLTPNGLMQVILASGTTEQELDSDLQERLVEAEHQQDTDASLNSVLVLAAQAEIDQLRNVITTSAQVEEDILRVVVKSLRLLLSCWRSTELFPINAAVL